MERCRAGEEYFYGAAKARRAVSIKPGASAPGKEDPNDSGALKGRQQTAGKGLLPPFQGFECDSASFLGLTPQALC
jgi:hypothetical protein